MFTFSKCSILRLQYLIINSTFVSFVLHEWDSHDLNLVGLQSFSHFIIVSVTPWSRLLYCFSSLGDHLFLDCAVFFIFSNDVKIPFIWNCSSTAFTYFSVRSGYFVSKFRTLPIARASVPFLNRISASNPEIGLCGLRWFLLHMVCTLLLLWMGVSLEIPVCGLFTYHLSD